MPNIAADLDRVLKRAGIAIQSVSIGDSADKSTWKVYPAVLQLRAQPHIDIFSKDDPQFVRSEADTAVDGNHILQIGIRSVLKHLPAMVNEITGTGSLRESLWLKRIEATAMTLARARRRV